MFPRAVGNHATVFPPAVCSITVSGPSWQTRNGSPPIAPAMAWISSHLSSTFRQAPVWASQTRTSWESRVTIRRPSRSHATLQNTVCTREGG